MGTGVFDFFFKGQCKDLMCLYLPSILFAPFLSLGSHISGVAAVTFWLLNEWWSSRKGKAGSYLGQRTWFPFPSATLDCDIRMPDLAWGPMGSFTSPAVASKTCKCPWFGSFFTLDSNGSGERKWRISHASYFSGFACLSLLSRIGWLLFLPSPILKTPDGLSFNMHSFETEECSHLDSPNPFYIDSNRSYASNGLLSSTCR